MEGGENRMGKDLNKTKGLSKALDKQSLAEIEEKKVKYLIRRKNKYGQWVHIDTVQFLPFLYFGNWQAFVRDRYGPGRYHIATVEEGLAGMHGFLSFSISFDLNFLEWLPEKPTVEYLNKKYPLVKDFYICRATDVTPIAVPRNLHGGEPVWDVLEQGISALTSGYLVFEVKGIPS